jgi:hypothetical protein
LICFREDRRSGHRLQDPQRGRRAQGDASDPNGNVIELIELAPGLTTSRLQETYGTDAPAPKP